MSPHTLKKVEAKQEREVEGKRRTEKFSLFSFHFSLFFFLFFLFSLPAKMFVGN